MRHRELMCVGGPMHGQKVHVTGRSMLVPSIKPTFLARAAEYDPSVFSPDALVPLETACYRVERVAWDSADGLSLNITVLAYYGRDSQDRPKGWCL